MKLVRYGLIGLILILDIYIMGIVDLFKPKIYALIFIGLNYLAYSFLIKKDIQERRAKRRKN